LNKIIELYGKNIFKTNSGKNNFVKSSGKHQKSEKYIITENISCNFIGRPKNITSTFLKNISGKIQKIRKK